MTPWTQHHSMDTTPHVRHVLGVPEAPVKEAPGSPLLDGLQRAVLHATSATQAAAEEQSARWWPQALFTHTYQHYS